MRLEKPVLKLVLLLPCVSITNICYMISEVSSLSHFDNMYIFERCVGFFKISLNIVITNKGKPYYKTILMESYISLELYQALIFKL